MRKVSRTLVLGVVCTVLLSFGCSQLAQVGETMEAPEQDSLSQDSNVIPDANFEVPPLDFVFEFMVPDDGLNTGTDHIDLGSGCEPGTGCFLDPCEEGSDCLSGWCVNHMGNSVCTIECIEECPEGFECKQVGSGPDVGFACLSPFTHLCRPCSDSNDCKAPTGVEDVCVSYGDTGSFCGADCSDTGLCPLGFDCAAALTVEGGEVQQCVPTGGAACDCSKTSVKLGLTTPCWLENEFGTCEGLRACTADGLTDCDAAVPAQEVCDGTDNDCDGEIDNLDCDDGDACTEDSCDPAQGCLHTPLTGTECSDGDVCTLADHCDAGICTGSLISCDDGDPCTSDLCDPAGGCQYEFNYNQCSDDDPCTVADMCVEGECLGVAVSCDCTTDAECAALEDEDLCNGTLICDLEQFPYKCIVDPDTLVKCEAPEGQCQVAQCAPDSGECTLSPADNGKLCDDEDACTIGDVCGDGTCISGVPLNCNDGNPCTDDSCDIEDGCLHVANVGPCEDGNPCTLGDKCADGLCAPGIEQSCNDGNLCTDDVCDADLGCLHTPNQVPCDDGSLCTQPDICTAGQCKGGAPLDCADDNPCTDDACDPAVGCLHTLNQAPCNDGDICTVNDHCQLGQCAGSGDLLCDDNDPCTDDACNPDTGCTFTPIQSDECQQQGCPAPFVECPNGCADTVNDPANCGECDKVCTPAVNTAAVCAAGQCANVCIGTFENCNLDWTDGCERDLATDLGNCGECDKPCGEVVNGSALCSDGECEIETCDDNFDDCDGLYDTGCEVNLLTDPLNCNQCAGICNADAGELCINGKCTCPPDCDGKFCGPDGCGGSCGECAGEQDACLEGHCICQPDCDGKNCGDNGCGESCGTCQGPNDQCQDGQCVCVADCDGVECGDDGCGGDCGQCEGGKNCIEGICQFLDVGSFQVIETKDIVYNGIYYLLLKVSLSADTSHADNWCYEYENLCSAFGYVPTGCGDNFNFGGYGDCKDTYGSDGTSNSLGCNPSGGIANAASQNGFADATGTNSFGFHSCGGNCAKQMCTGDHCNTALSYIDMDQAHGYTLCLKCKPDCDGKVCGDDGCGGNCGECQGQQDACILGQCLCQPACDGLECGDDGCGGSCGGCGDKICGDDGCGGNCGLCLGPQEECIEGACICQPDCDNKNCGPDGCGGSCGSCNVQGDVCHFGECKPTNGSWVILDQKDIVYQGIYYLLLKVGMASDQATSANWCQEYTDLCQSYGYVPTGCGDNFNSGGYLQCKTQYLSDGTSNTLGCNPSGGVSSAAQQNGYNDATSKNSFGFHSCGGSCEKTLCTGDHCNSAISYIDMSKPHGYTLCLKCKPDCDGKNCGDDGCGGSCGLCQGQQDACIDGQCICQPACDGLFCGPDGCGGSCSTCVGKECGDDGCGGDCGACPEQHVCQNNQCVCVPDCNDKNCGPDGCGGGCGNCGIPGDVCHAGVCSAGVGSFVVMETKDVLYQGIYYLLLKVALASTTATSDNWCYEYQHLCQHYGYVPTGCGDNFNSGGYLQCKTQYGSDGTSNSLGCNPSGGISSAAQQNGYNDATSKNSFGFHSCGGSCEKEMCSGDHCNSAISYIDATKPHGYTLCLKCKPDCDGKVCGSDGCEGSCGDCQGQQDACVDGQCVCQPACDGLLCGPDGCGGSCGGCNGNECGDDGCGGICGTCPEQHICTNGSCVCQPDCNGKNCGSDGCGGSCGNCGADESCHEGDCKPTIGSFIVLDNKDITYQGIDYLLLKVGLASPTSQSPNWCYEYMNLCAAFGPDGYSPTGCGDNFNSGGYLECKTTYGSDGTSNTLGCNPSGGISSAAQQNGFNDATSQNSFGFHSCNGSCQKEMCAGNYCNSALSYMDMSKPHGYTLCKK